MSRSLYVLIPLTVVLTILQATVLARLPIFNVVLQPALLIALTWTLLRGLYEGLVWAFVVGIVLDLFSVGPTGGTALALMLAVFPLAYLNQLLPDSPYLIPILLTALGMALFFLAYTLIVVLAQRGFRANVLLDLPLTILVNTLLSIPIYWLLRSLARLLYPRQIEM